jgi:hypothetical protein
MSANFPLTPAVAIAELAPVRALGWAAISDPLKFKGKYHPPPVKASTLISASTVLH